MLFPTMELNQVYFYTATILKWKKLLVKDEYKEIIMDSLQYLVKNKKMAIYGLVIMPNHIHLIMETLAKNGNEMPHASFMKYTAHCFLKDLRQNHQQILPYFSVDDQGRNYQFCQRNSLPIIIYKEDVLQQKLKYIHDNPIKDKWKLVAEPSDYHYSSAKFYETGIDDLDLITHYKDRN